MQKVRQKAINIISYEKIDILDRLKHKEKIPAFGLKTRIQTWSVCSNSE
jgi:hypothetical protein